MKLSISLLVLFTLLLLSPLTAFAGVFDPRALGLARSSFPSVHAQHLIRALNLFPESDANIIPTVSGDRSPVTGGKRIFEKRFNLPNVVGESGGSVEDLGHHAGYFNIEHSHAGRMFYLFFESRSNNKDPVVIWLTGGPGCSSELAVFYENGPFTIADNMSLVWNQYGWDKTSNLLYVDQPIGTGFSYSSDRRDIHHSEDGVSNDLYDFLQAFFAEHPELADNDFYITGESYAGHYIPAFASRVHKGNKAKEGIHINLKGFAIGNGLTDPGIQYKAYTDYALDNGVISKTDYDRINKVLPVCEMAIKLCGTDGTVSCMASYFVCNSIFSSIMAKAGNINYYDIRKKCEGSLCYDFSNMEKFLKQKSVKKALGVGDIDFVSCSPTVYQAMLVDWMRNLEVGIPTLLEDGIQLLVYAGEYDLICNWLGNSRWVHAMEWSGQKNFVNSPEVPFVVDDAEAGVLKSYGPLSFLKVHDAGHMVPMDQPKAALTMLKRWTQGTLAEDAAEPEKLVAQIFSAKSSAEGVPSSEVDEEESKFVPLNAESMIFGPPALLLLGFELEEAATLQEFLKMIGGDFLKIIFCTDDMITGSLRDAMNKIQPNLVEVKIAKPLPRICFLSGLSGEEMMMLIDDYPETGLEPAVFAALVPNSAEKPIAELIDEIMADHEMIKKKMEEEEKMSKSKTEG